MFSITVLSVISSDSDPNAIDFAKGYNSVVWGDEVPQEQPGKTNSQGMTLVGDQVAPGWDNSKGQTIFQQQFTAHKNINATIEANDGLANAVVTVLKQNGVGANKIPTVGRARMPSPPRCAMPTLRFPGSTAGSPIGTGR